MLPILNRVARLVSLRVVSAGTPTRDFRAFFRHLKARGFDFRTVIDVGVAFGSLGLYEDMPGAKFYLVEPVPACQPILEALGRRLNAETFNVAAGAADGSMAFFVHPDVSGSSAYPQWEGSFFDGEPCTVPVRRLDGLIRATLERPALLKIDTQGSELEVLAGAAGLLDQIDMVIVEASLHPFRKGAPEFHDIVLRMTQLGFVVYEAIAGHYRPIDNALAQIDLVFIRPQSALRKDKAFFSPAQAQRYLEEEA